MWVNPTVMCMWSSSSPNFERFHLFLSKSTSLDWTSNIKFSAKSLKERTCLVRLKVKPVSSSEKQASSGKVKLNLNSLSNKSPNH